jgi:uncharacterized RDD family membrane protein YckC
MTQPSGWYEDPQDTSQFRYWDGVVWSSHVTPKVSPTVEQSNIGMPYSVAPAAARPQPPGSQGAGHGAGQGQQGGPRGQWPAYGQDPGQLGQQPPGWASQAPTTPDGVLLSGWWKRVGARAIDSIIVWIMALPLTLGPLEQIGTVFSDYIQAIMAAVETGSTTTPPQPTAELTGPILQYSLTVLAVYLVYEIALLTMTGATIGKRILGISVRLRDKPGPPPLVAVLKRTAVKEGGNIIGSVPVLGVFGSLFGLLDALWPLWDDKKQAIHDRVGATNVVVGPQPRRKPDA